MKIQISAIIVSLLFCFGGSSLSAQPRSALRVGFIGGFSGPGKPYGEACKNGFEMGQSSSSASFEVVYEDDQFQPAKTVAAFKKLVEIDKVSIVIVLGSSPANSIAPLAQKKKVPLIAWASDSRVSKGRSYVFRSWASGAAEGQIIAAEAERRGISSLAFFTYADDYSQSVWQGFKDKFSGKILYSLEYPRDTLDFHPQLLRLRSLGIANVGICLNVGQPALFARQARQMNLGLTLFGCETLHNAAEMRQAQGALEGAWFATIAVEDWFHQAYLNNFKNEDLIGGAAIHYELARLFASIDQEPQTADSIRNALSQLKMPESAVGPFAVSCADQDCRFDLKLLIKEISASGFRKLG